MDHDTNVARRETPTAEKAALAFDSLDLIERATTGGCSPRALQDIVGNILVLLAWLDDDDGAGRLRAQAVDARVRTLLVDCLVKAGVPPHAVPDSLGLIRDCFGDAGLIAELELDRLAAGAPIPD